MKSPFSVLTAVRLPCNAGDVAVTVTPGKAPASELTRPEIVPVGLP